ncbi:hypothetical protein LXL04_011410 [Taraxacum kok-saghyz]
MDDKDKVDPISGGFSSDPTWTFQGDYSFFGNDVRESSVLSDFGWNFQPQSPAFDRIDSDAVGTSVSLPEVGGGVVANDLRTGSVDEAAGDVSMSNPLVSSSSSEDRVDTSTVSGDAASGGKPPSSERAVKVKKKGPKKIRQPRFAFMTKSEVDHLEDGYRWRKYGQKAVKNSPFPRSYYRCTNSKCTVKKRVERSCDDPTIVVTTYEGQHCHHTVGFPRGLISHHEASYARQLAAPPSLGRPPLNNNSRPQFLNPLINSVRSSQSIPQLLMISTDHDHKSSQGSDRVDQGLLGDMVPPRMRNQ